MSLDDGYVLYATVGIRDKEASFLALFGSDGLFDELWYP